MRHRWIQIPNPTDSTRSRPICSQIKLTFSSPLPQVPTPDLISPNFHFHFTPLSLSLSLSLRSTKIKCLYKSQSQNPRKTNSQKPKRIKNGAIENHRSRIGNGIPRRVRPIEGVLGAREIDRRGSIESRGGSNCAPRDRNPEASDFGAGHSEEEDEGVHNPTRLHRNARPRRVVWVHPRRQDDPRRYLASQAYRLLGCHAFLERRSRSHHLDRQYHPKGLEIGQLSHRLRRPQRRL